MATNMHAYVAITMDPDEDDDDGSPSSCHYDVLMIGKTGKGKSTIGNKYLGINPETKSLYEEGERIETVIKRWGFMQDGSFYFKMGVDETDSITKSCALLSNTKTMNRVLDTTGFADSEDARRYGVMITNLKNFRWILQHQRQYDLRFRRVVYFLPERGPLRKADGQIQEEIQVMHGFFGQKIFDIMVIVATNDPHPGYQSVGFPPDTIKVTQRAFMAAYNKATGEKLPKCPPIIYVPVDQHYRALQDAIISAEVIQEEDLFFTPEYPRASSFDKEGDEPPILVSIEQSRQSVQRTIRQNIGKRFKFENRCTRCAVKIVEDVHSGNKFPLRVIYGNNDSDDYMNSYCHPTFIPKHSRLVKFAGGIAHIITLGMGKMYEALTGNQSWPGFWNSEEICPVETCKKSPGSPGCTPVQMDIEIKGAGRIHTDHSKKLDVLKLVENVSA